MAWRAGAGCGGWARGDVSGAVAWAGRGACARRGDWARGADGAVFGLAAGVAYGAGRGLGAHLAFNPCKKTSTMESMARLRLARTSLKPKCWSKRL